MCVCARARACVRLSLSSLSPYLFSLSQFVCTYTHMYIHTHTRACTQAHMYTHTHTCACTQVLGATMEALEQNEQGALAAQIRRQMDVMDV